MTTTEQHFNCKNVNGLRPCNKCKQLLPPTSEYFHKANGAKNLNGTCKPCQRKYASEWRKKQDPERLRRVDKSKYLVKNYGITLDDFERMVAEREGLCDICGKPETITRRKREGTAENLAVDHCHETGKVRGLLCTNCNTGLGLLGDTVEGLEKALAYLRKVSE